MKGLNGRQHMTLRHKESLGKLAVNTRFSSSEEAERHLGLLLEMCVILVECHMTSIRRESPDAILPDTNKNIGTDDVQCLMKIITVNYRRLIIEVRKNNGNIGFLLV